jgi:diguanylate cyclase (GGDEF)-like protein
MCRDRPASRPHPVSIAMFDLDGSEDINDTLGHATGDQLLEEVAAVQ